jgi:hypothetical protein
VSAEQPDPYRFMAADWFRWFILAVAVVAAVNFALGDIPAGALTAGMAAVLAGLRLAAQRKAEP